MTTLASSPTASSARTASAGLYRFAVITAVWMLLHIKGGAIVTSTGSGMAFTDWPLADGSIWPPGMGLDKLFEHLHRISGAIVGAMAIGLLVGIWRVDRRPFVVKLGWLLLLMVIAQGVLGGLGVLYGHAGGRTWAPAAIGHGILAQPTLCLSVLIAFILSPAFQERLEVSPEVARTARRLSTFALGLVFVQLIVGTVVRHTNQQSMLWLHVFMALLVALAILIANAYCAGKLAAHSRGLQRLSRWTLGLLLLQLTLGFITLAVRKFKDPSNIEYLGRSILVSGHVVVGAGLFLLTTLLVARTWRNLVPRSAAP